jgi:exodeoxyribonuclease III
MSKFKIATFNTNSVRSRIDIITGWLKKESPDVLCLQETKVQDADFPIAAFEQAGYNSVYFGQKSYNGVAILSPREMTDARTGLSDGEENPEQARLIAATAGGVRVVNTYVPQGFEIGSEKFQYKLSWFARLKKYFDRNHRPGELLIWTGDFNVAPEPMDVHDPEGLEGHVGVHPDDRAALADVKAWGFIDVFRKHVPDPQQFTFWDYRLRGALEKNAGWRIDHIWATPPLAEKSTAAWIDIGPRRLEKPSDHTFLVAEFEL